MRVVLLWVGLALACGDDSSMVDAGPGADASTDGGGVDSAFDSAFDSAIDAPFDAGGGDAAPDANGTDASTDSGGEGCGSGDIVSGFELPRTCMEAECLDHATCEEADRIAAGYGDHTLCGTMPITAGSSAEACMTEMPFPWPESPPYECGRITYEGRVNFYCNADRTSIAARFVATHTDLGGGFTEYFGHDFQAGSGGGSGDSRTSSALVDVTTSRFFGWQEVELEAPGTSTQLQVWFMTGSFTDPELGLAYTGGFIATVPPE